MRTRAMQRAARSALRTAAVGSCSREGPRPLLLLLLLKPLLPPLLPPPLPPPPLLLITV